MGEQEEKQAKKHVPIPLLVGVAVAVLIVLILFGRFCSSAATIDVTLNGTPLTIHGAKTMETAIRESGLPINPGDLISLQGHVLKKSAGHAFKATVNDRETADPGFQLHNGDVITVDDGDDLVEEYDSVDEPLPHGGSVAGLGAICKITPGVNGVYDTRTGRISGEVVQKVKTAAVDTEAERYNPDVGDDKVIALTFDEGPSELYTASILDILRENDAKATFFCMGSKVANSASLVQRERDDGHQVCSATFSLAWTAILSGKDDGSSIDTERVVDEVTRGQQALGEALGEEPGRCVRIPAPDMSGETVAALEDLIDADISWNSDTGDWMEYNEGQVYNVLVNAEPGDVILLHDGGGDRSATISALARALPELREKGFSCITIDDLMGYGEE